MPQTSSNLSAQKIFPSYAETPSVDAAPVDSQQLESVMSELNRLSKSFVNSYQTLETQVEKLNGQLINESQEKQSAIEETQKLLIEKAALSDRLQNLLSILPAGVVVIDGDGKVKDCNATATDILGRPLLGQTWVSIIQRAFQPQADDGHQVSLKDGRKIHIETRALDSEPGQLVVLTDLTKTRELQAELSQQQKLTSMGKMIASLAHQIRTPLAAAILYGSHLNNQNVEATLKQKFSNHLMERLHYMERQITDMLNFVKGERKQKQLIEVSNFYQKLVSLQSDFDTLIDLTIDDESHGKFEIYGDLDALIGAMVNLIENACDASKEKALPKIQVNFKLADELIISISDNGKGISEEKLNKIFEPFYTDKKSGNGLGLAIVYGIVIEHKGQIKVISKEQQGTLFEIKLPRALSSTTHLKSNNQETVHEF